MTTLSSDATGVREPKYRSVPDAVSTAGPEAVELAAGAGLHLDPWQSDVLDASLGEGEDGSWASTETGLIVPRQNGKGADLEAAVLHSLFLTDDELTLWSAHEFKTAQEGFRRVRALVESNPFMRRRVRSIRTANGDEGIELNDGSRLRFVARSRGSGRGFSCDFLILDEAYELGDDVMSAMLFALSARPNPRVWYTSSAPHLTSAVLRRLCKRGRAGLAARLAYLEWCAAADAASDDEAAWLEANPGVGYRLTLEWIRGELEIMDDEDFRRERMGIWHEDVSESHIDLAVWAGLRDSRSRPGDPVAFAFDVSPDRKRSAIGVAGRRRDGAAHVEVVDDRPGTSWVVPRLVELVERHGPCVLVVDGKGPGASLIPSLAEHGIVQLNLDGPPGADLHSVLDETSASDMARACGAFFDGITDEMVRHLGQPELDGAIESAARRPLGDAWAWSRKDSVSSISPLVAVTLAYYGLLEHGPGETPREKPFVMVT